MAKYNVIDCNAVSYADNDKIRFPRFQRKKTWAAEDNFKLCISIFKGYPIGVVIINELGGFEYLLDGRQRLTALRLMKSNPKEIYKWAKSFVKFTQNEAREDLINKFWKSIDVYLQHDAAKPKEEKVISSKADIDVIDSNEEETDDYTTEEEGKSTFDFETQYKSLTTLLDLILLCHPYVQKDDMTNLEKMYLFNGIIDSNDLMEYVDPSNGEYVVNCVKLWDFIGTLSKSNYKTKDQFTNYLIRRYRLGGTASENKIRNWIHQHWDFYCNSLDVHDRLRSVLNQASIGQIKLLNAEPLDAQNIFSLVNHSGTPLSAEELFSARPFWNIKIKNPSFELLECKKSMYSFLEIDLPEDTCRWDLCSSFLKRIDKNNLIFERDNSFTTSISLSYRLISALLVGGLNNVSILKLETQKIDWETDIEKLIKDLNMMISVLEDMDTFKYMMEWNQSMMSLTSNAIAIEFCTLLYKVWKYDLGCPAKTSANRKIFERNAVFLFDRLVYEYSSRVFSGSGDSLVASHLVDYRSRIDKSLDKNDWEKFIEEIDTGKIRGKKTSTQILKPFIYYHCILNKKKPAIKDGAKNLHFEIDHIVAQKLFKNNPLADEIYKDNYLNYSLLPKADNIEKNDKRLNTIQDKWLKEQIIYYSEIKESDFETLSDITKVSELKSIRKKGFIKTFTSTRDSYLANL